MRNGFVFVLLGLFCFFNTFVFSNDKSFDLDPSTILETLRKAHPRLMLPEDDLQNLKKIHEKDETLKKYVSEVLSQADKCLGKKPLVHKLIGPRLLSVSRECLKRIYALGLAWTWTGDKKYAEKARENLLTVCAFPDWNPSHFLDTAEMSHAVGIGYDWTFHYLDEADRKKIRTGLINLGMKPGMKAYKEEFWWTSSGFNWNQVCNGGLLIGALAIAETDPEYARFIVPHAVKSLPASLASYKPDGLWMEGPAYWDYATRYTAYGLCSLETALGTDFGLSNSEGFSVTGFFPYYLIGPTGLYMNFADCRENCRPGAKPCMFWLAKKFKQPFLSDKEHEMAQNKGIQPQHVIWYTPPSGEKHPALSLDKYFKSPVEIAVFRSSWEDPNALFVAVKAGYNQVNHGHLDLGNFEMDALGVRWARDLGADNYNLPGYWDKEKGGKRWKIFRMNSESHSVPLLGGKGQDEEAISRFLKTGEGKDTPFVVVDISSAYKEFADKVLRGICLINDRKATLVQDEFEIKDSCSLEWGMITDATIDVKENGVAEMSLKGKKMIARILSPKGANFSVESVEKKPPERSNKGVSRLTIKLNQASGKTRIAVLLSPVWNDGKAVKHWNPKDLSEW